MSECSSRRIKDSSEMESIAGHDRPAFLNIHMLFRNTPKNPDDLEKQTTKDREEDNSSETSDCGEVETMISAIAEQSRNNATELAEVKEALASMKDRHTALCEYVLDMKCDQRDIRKAVLDSLAILKLQETRVREVSPSPPPRRYDPDRINDLLSSTRFPLTENTSSQQSNNLSNTRISNIDSTLSGVRVRREYTLNSKITYADWLEHLKSELEHYDLIDFIDPEINLGDDPNVKKSRSIVQSLIISRVDKSYQSKLINIKDPHELLSKIKEIRKVENNLNVYSLKKDIYNITMKKNESANDFCNRFDNMLKLYDSCDPKDKFTEYDKAAAFYNATQERCTELRSLVKLRKLNHENELTIEEMKSCLLQDEIDKAAKVNPPPAARAVGTTKSGGEPSKCHRCEQKGHLAPECPLGPYKLWYCYGCKKITGHKTPACPNVQQRSVESDSNKTEIPNNERRKGGGKWAKGKNQNKKPYKKPKGSPSKSKCLFIHPENRLPQYPRNIEFIADSGATEHITNKGFLLSSFNKCDGEITCANKNADANILIDGKGTLILKSRVDGKNIELSNVISAPDACENLMSLRKFVDSGYSIYLDDETITISDKNTKETYLTGIYDKPNWILSFEARDLTRDSITLDCRAKARLISLADFPKQALTITEVTGLTDSQGPPSELGRESLQKSVETVSNEHAIKRKILDLNDIVPDSDLDHLIENKIESNKIKFAKPPSLGMLWHMRLGHASLEYLRQLQKREEKLKDVKFSKEILDCETCIMAKMESLPFKNNRKRSDRCLHTIHTDTMGPISPSSFPDNNRFIIAFIDDHSRYAKVYCVKNKFESGDSLESYLKHVRNLSDKNENVCYIRADNGTEFTGGKFAEIMEKEGMSKDFAPPYTPELNGTAERFNKTIQKKIRALMIDSGLPQTMWSVAAEAATYIYNRTPHKGLEFKTPLSIINENKDSHITELKRFGCLSYVKIPIAQNKFSERAVKAFLVGYSSTGYLLWHPQTNRFLNSRHVRCNEKIVYRDRLITNTENNYENTDAIEQFTIESDPIEFVSQSETNKVVQSNIDSNIETAVPQIPKNTRKRKPECVPKVLPERRAKKIKLQHPDFVYRIKQIDYLPSDIEIHANLAEVNRDPVSYKQAMESAQKAEWLNAINEELKSMKENKVWNIIDKPERNSDGSKLNLIDSKWVFKRKTDEFGNQKFKARLVIRGFKDKNTYELKETYAPVSRLATIRTALAVINKLNLDAVQLDVKTAFLNGQLEDEIYMEIPDGLEVESLPNKRRVCKLLKTIYGLKTSPKIWNRRFTTEVNKLGLERDINEPCLFTWRKQGKVAILVLYVDDIILASNCKEKLTNIKDNLCRTFEMKDLGEPRKYLGMEITRNRAENTMILTQRDYTIKVLERFKMHESKAQSTPMVTRQVKNKEFKVEEYVPLENQNFRAAIGSLMYLATVTRPDIAYAVNYLSRKQAAPSEEDWKDVKRIFRYLQGTRDTGLIYKANNENMYCHTDSSFRDHQDSTSTSGYVIKLFGDAISWRSHKQVYVSLSTCQAEYLAMSEAAAEIVSLDKAIRDMLGKTMFPAKIWCDNRSAIDCTQMDGSHKLKNFDSPLDWITHCLNERERTGKKKHMADTHGDYVKSCALEGRLTISWVNTKENEADIMTKPLPAPSHNYLKDKILNRLT
ncbi:hypothetical protein TKK_0013555 [Trichogramma kaykai]